MLLGAGASAARPAQLPAFWPLAQAVLEQMGWEPVGPVYRRRGWEGDDAPTFAPDGVAPEVLFGTLQRSHISFARSVARALDGKQHNAVHAAAAEVLARGGCVWTTNIDRLVERACGRRPHRAGRAQPLAPLLDAGPGSLVKFHGTCEAPASLAFTDRELLAPPRPAEVEHLAALADGRTVVVYGYAGADADLYGLLERTFTAADEVVWFEPSRRSQALIRRAFPESSLRFIPEFPPSESAAGLERTGAAFVDFAADAGVRLDAVLAEALCDAGGQPPLPQLTIDRPPGIAHARLVERFGTPKAEQEALRLARLDDLRHLRVRAFPGHVRWAINDSLYGNGVVASSVDWLSHHHAALLAIRPGRLRDWAITRGHALRLQRRRWEDVNDLASWAVEHRPGGPRADDYYYRAHARRYMLRVDEAMADAERAEAGLSASRDPERHAGAVLEQGCLAIYRGEFDRALRAAFELRERTGRYAIPRWRAWGAWLEGITRCHLGQAAEAQEALDKAAERFIVEGRPGPLADVETARLLAVRVRLAQGEHASYEPTIADAQALGGRYVDDRSLVLADLALAVGDRAEAERLLRAIAGDPSCPVGEAWAMLGLAEVARLDGAVDAAEKFRHVARLARSRGAEWLAQQAALGVACSDGDLATARLGFGHPRVLWMMTA